MSLPNRAVLAAAAVVPPIWPRTIMAEYSDALKLAERMLAAALPFICEDIAKEIEHPDGEHLATGRTRLVIAEQVRRYAATEQVMR